MFNKAHEENCKMLEQEMKKSAENEKSKMNASQKESENPLQTTIRSSNVKWFKSQPKPFFVLWRIDSRQ